MSGIYYEFTELKKEAFDSEKIREEDKEEEDEE